jgi:hypothetical protein
MAGDLIPPPSPARRSDPEADPKATAKLEEAAQLGAEAVTPVEVDPPPFRNRFGFLFGALAGIALCAAAGFALLLGTTRDDGPRLAANWSQWQPETSRMLEGAEEIAEHVNAGYRHEGGGGPLVDITASSLETDGQEIGIAVRPKQSAIEKLEGEGLIYNLMGPADGGTVEGAPSKKRGRLLMREALELALYSFRYLEDVTMVAVLIPPSRTQTTGQAPEPRRAIFYRPGDLLPQLQVPLAETLSPKTPTAATMTEAETARVEELTLSNLFLTTVRSLETDKDYLVLVEPDRIE